MARKKWWVDALCTAGPRQSTHIIFFRRSQLFSYSNEMLRIFQGQYLVIYLFSSLAKTGLTFAICLSLRLGAEIYFFLKNAARDPILLLFFKRDVRIYVKLRRNEERIRSRKHVFFQGKISFLRTLNRKRERERDCRLG